MILEGFEDFGLVMPSGLSGSLPSTAKLNPRCQETCDRTGFAGGVLRLEFLERR